MWKRSRRFTKHPPCPDSQYGAWSVVGKPLLKLCRSKHYTAGMGYQERWWIPVECECGTRDIIEWANLKSGESRRCHRCHACHASERGTIHKVYTAWEESKTLKEWLQDERCRVSLAVAKERLRLSLEFHRVIIGDGEHGRLRSRKLSPQDVKFIFESIVIAQKPLRAFCRLHGFNPGNVSHIANRKRDEWITFGLSDTDVLPEDAEATFRDRMYYYGGGMYSDDFVRDQWEMLIHKYRGKGIVDDAWIAWRHAVS